MKHNRATRLSAPAPRLRAPYLEVLEEGKAWAREGMVPSLGGEFGHIATPEAHKSAGEGNQTRSRHFRASWIWRGVT